MSTKEWRGEYVELIFSNLMKEIQIEINIHQQPSIWIRNTCLDQKIQKQIRLTNLRCLFEKFSIMDTGIISIIQFEEAFLSSPFKGSEFHLVKSFCTLELFFLGLHVDYRYNLHPLMPLDSLSNHLRVSQSSRICQVLFLGFDIH